MYLLKAKSQGNNVSIQLAAYKNYDSIVEIFDAEAVVAVKKHDNAQVLELARKHKLAFALYHPEVTEVENDLSQMLDGRMRSHGKILYLRPEQKASWQASGWLERFMDQGAVVFEGDYEEHCLDLVRYNMCWGGSFE